MTPQEYIKALETRNKELREVLASLHAVQNGSPLEKYDREWKAAMEEAERLLAIDALQPPPDKPKVYGCHCELGSGEKPDDCVMDTFPEDCVSATQLLRDGKTREDCPYWREVKEEEG